MKFLRNPNLILVFLLPFFFGNFTACREQQPSVDLQPPVKITPADRKFAHVFKPLNGKWRGTFYIYENPNPGKENAARPEIAPGFDPGKSDFKLLDSILVEQEYISQTPYFQRVVIRDSYVNPDGSRRTVLSKGINKVQDGQLWCIVQKPDETVVHRGKWVKPATLIWQRNLRNPLRIEYFWETVEADSYSIVGWGYYGQDDPKSAPHLWFRAIYHRLK